jgi:hypothetical protein
MAFQLSGFQATGFQVPRQDQRRPGGIVMDWHDGVTPRKTTIKVHIDSEAELMAIVSTFIRNVLQ